VIIQLRSIGRAEPDDLAAILPTLSEAAEAVDLDHSRIAVVLDWVQYRKNFRAPVMVRPFVGSTRDGRGDEPLAEIAIDVRRAGAIDRAMLRTEIVDRLSKALGIMPDIHECTHLEDWVRPSKSVTWSFNRSYWRHLGAWDETFEKDYAAALPGGVSDGTSPAFWADRIDAFMATLNRLDEWSELPDEIHVLELGVGDGQGAKVWLDAFAAACEEQGRDYVDRVRYLMADYSPHVLARAKERVSEYAHLVRCLELDFRNPMSALSELRGKLLFAHTCNVYDNLPTDEVMRVGNHAYEPLVRASITPAEMADLGSGQTCARPCTSRRSTSRSRHRRRCASHPAPTSTSTSWSTTCRSGRACTCRRWPPRASRRPFSSCTMRASSSRRTCSRATSATTPRIVDLASSRARSSTGSTPRSSNSSASAAASR
jgi:putative S-adenosyl-L-methionine-dependent methyltransferase